MALHYNPRIVTSGLILCLDAANTKSYPGSGTAWIDLSTSTKNASLVNEPTFSSGNAGIFTFDGTNDHATIPSSSPLSGTQLFTFSCWINLTSITGNFGGTTKCAWLFAGGSGSGAGQPEFSVLSANNSTFTPNTIDFARGSGGTTGSLSVSVSSLMSNGSWYQIVLARTGVSSQILYLNGTQIGTGNVSNSFTDGITSFGGLPGNASYSGYLNGKLSNILIYNRALSAAEVAQNFNALRGRFGI